MDRRVSIARLLLDGPIPAAAADYLRARPDIAPTSSVRKPAGSSATLYLTGRFSIHRALTDTAKMFKKGRTTLLRWADEDGDWTSISPRDLDVPSVATVPS